MADREVTVRYKVDATQAAAALERLTKDTEQLNAAAGKSTAGVAGLGGRRADPFLGRNADLADRARERLGEGADPRFVSEAAKRILRQRAAAEVKTEMARLGHDFGGPDGGTPPGAPMGGPTGVDGRGALDLGARWKSQAITLLGIGATGQLAAGAGRGLGALADPSLRASEALGAFTSEMTSQLPLVGGFFRALGDAGKALSGLSTIRMAAAQFAEVQARQLARLEVEQQARFGGEQELLGKRLGLGGARANAAAQAAALAGMTPDVLRSFAPRERFGIANAELGEARRAEYQARFGVGAADEKAAQADAELRNAAEASAAADARAADIQQKADAAKTALAKAKRDTELFSEGSDDTNWRAEARRRRKEKIAFNAAQGIVVSQDALDASLRKDEDERRVKRGGVYRREEEATAKAGETAAQVGPAREEQERRTAAHKEAIARAEAAQTDQARQQLNLAKATEAVDRARLGLLDQRIARAKGGALAAGMARPGDTQALVSSAEQAKRLGFQSLTPEQKQDLLGNPETRDFAERGLRDVGERDPALKRLRETVAPFNPLARAAARGLAPFFPGLASIGDDRGGDAGGLEGMQAGRDELAAKLTKKAGEIETAMANAVVTAMGASLDQLVIVIAKGIKDSIDKRVGELEAKQAGQQIAARANGQ